MVTIDHNPEASGLKLAPQVVLLLDDDVRVLDVNRGLAGTNFESISASEQHSLHAQLHPDCDGRCRFNELWTKAWASLKGRDSVEWEVNDPELHRLLRLNLSTQPTPKSVKPDRRQRHKILTITDITKYRREYESLVQRQQELVDLLTEQVTKSLSSSDDETADVSDTGSRLVAGLIAQDESFGRQLIRAQENECKRIASELHDGISQTIGVLKYKLEASTAALARQNPDLDLKGFDEVVGEIKGLIDEIRRISNNLAPSILEDFGLQVALEILCKEFSARNSGVTVNCESRLDEGETLDLVKFAIYRIVQEALNNVTKHASATNVDVSLNSTVDGVRLVISDNGLGFDPEGKGTADSPRRGLGLRSMRERVAASAGTIEVRSAPGEGFEICAEWPRQKPEPSPK